MSKTEDEVGHYKSMERGVGKTWFGLVDGRLSGDEYGESHVIWFEIYGFSRDPSVDKRKGGLGWHIWVP